VAAEIVHDDDVTGLQGWNENFRDVDREALTIDRTFEKSGGIDAVVTERRQEGRGLPAPMRDLSDQTPATRSPAAQRRHVGLGPCLVDEHQTARINAMAILDPLRPSPRDVRTIAFASYHAFF